MWLDPALMGALTGRVSVEIKKWLRGVERIYSLAGPSSRSNIVPVANLCGMC